jgi:hypothetical protein
MTRATVQSVCLAVVFAVLSACGGGDDGPSGSKLFAGDSANLAIGSLTNANPGPGALPVDRIIVGPNTFLSSNITGFALDAANDRLYVANGLSVLVFNNASTADGNIAPSRVIPTSSNSLFLDTVNNWLYVADTSSVIRVFDNASTTTSATPARSITLSTGGSVFGVAVDVSKNILYALVSQSSAPNYSVRVIEAANALDGSVTPTRTIELNSTITNCGLFLDAAADRLYIGTASTQVLVYESASTKSGTASTAPPDRTIAFFPLGATKVAVDTANDRLYAVSGSSGFILSNASTANGAVTATQVFVSGSNLTAVAIRP